MTDETSRRAFVAKSAVSLAALAGAPYISLRRAPYDLVIRGGNVFDGTGAAAVQGDVGIAAGKITMVGARIATRAPNASASPRQALAMRASSPDASPMISVSSMGPNVVRRLPWQVRRPGRPAGSANFGHSA